MTPTALNTTGADIAFLLLATVGTLWYAGYLYQARVQGRLLALHLRGYNIALLSGWLLLATGLLGPVVLGTNSFAPHVAAHTLIALAAPPFFLLALPRILAWDLVPTQRRKLLVRKLTNPYLAGVIFESFIMLTHMPDSYELLVAHTAPHGLLHASLFVLGIWYWWPVVEPLPVWGMYGWLWKIVYLFLSRIPLFSLGIALALSPDLVYQPRVFGLAPRLSSILEQQIGGAVFIALTNVILLVALTAVALPRLSALSRE